MDKEPRISSASDSERPEPLEHEKDFEAVVGPASRVSSLSLSSPPAEPEAAASPADTIPDGGLEAWLQVVGAWAILVATWGLVNSFGVFQTYYETELLSSSSSSDISWIGSLQAALLLLVGPISGPLYDAGYFRELVVVGLFLIVFGQFMTSLCTQYWQILLAQGVTMGIGMGLTFLPSAAIMAQYFHKHRALALGISSTGSPLAGIVFPIIFSRVRDSLGFGWATRVIAFILLAVSVLPIAFMHTRTGTARRRALFDPTALHDPAYLIFLPSMFAAFLVLYVALLLRRAVRAEPRHRNRRLQPLPCHVPQRGVRLRAYRAQRPSRLVREP